MCLFVLEKEQALYTQLDDLHQNYLTTTNIKLQKLKSDIENDSNELDNIDPQKWNIFDRQRLTHHWFNLQQKLNEQHVTFTYKPNISSMNHSYLGEIHLKTPNQNNQCFSVARLQRQLPLLDLSDNQDESNQVQNKFCFQYETNTYVPFF